MFFHYYISFCYIISSRFLLLLCRFVRTIPYAMHLIVSSRLALTAIFRLYSCVALYLVHCISQVLRMSQRNPVYFLNAEEKLRLLCGVIESVLDA